ncbi:MAG TPA: mechanosensitive ion channel domain-containing protein [Acetobacteraceae bacterium]|nr:mechanosensitive ion channel domain-containing protein [Acetobacteraceae bacterium]
MNDFRLSLRVFPALVLLLASVLAAQPARAAATPLALLSGGASKTTAAKPAAQPLDAAQLQQAVATLQNPQQRAALIATLEAMQKSAAAKAAARPAAHQGIGERLLEGVSTRAGEVASDAGAAFKSATDISLVWRWILFVAANAWLMKALLHALIRLAVVLASALAAEYLVIFILSRPRTALIRRAAFIYDRDRSDAALRRNETSEAGLADAEAGATEPPPRRRVSVRRFLLRLCFGFAHFILSVLPLLAFAAIGFVWLSAGWTSERVTHLVLIAVLNAYLVCRGTLEVARFLVAPGLPCLRLIGMTDHRARWLVRWLRRIVAVIAFGYAAVTIGGLFGLYAAARMVLLRFIVLVVHIMLAIMVIQARRPVAAAIRGRRGTTGFIASLRRGIASIWHIVALFYVLALWIAWVIGVQNAFSTLLRIIVVFILGVALARGLAFAIGHGIESLFADDVTWKEAHPTLYRRGRSYIPALHLAIGFVVGLVALLIILQFWGIGVLGWLLATVIGWRILTAAITIGVTIVVALIAWEAANATLDARIDRLVAIGRIGRAARMRTLLPMLRTTLLVIILVIAGLTILSAIGVNVTLLLGGLSIFGLAVGFGSQKLVQDVINGLFLLMEDAMQVGDWITVGGISGSVERLSIRNIRLRGGDGSLNIVPFSSVTTVVNTSRDIGYAPINIGVGYKEDVDRVQKVLQEIFDSMKAEPEWAAQITGDFELWGLDQFGASSLVIAGRIKTPAGKQYGVKREFNRRVKIRFDAEGIELPYNYQKITIDPDEFREAFRPLEPAPRKARAAIAGPVSEDGVAR